MDKHVCICACVCVCVCVCVCHTGSLHAYHVLWYQENTGCNENIL